MLRALFATVSMILAAVVGWSVLGASPSPSPSSSSSSSSLKSEGYATAETWWNAWIDSFKVKDDAAAGEGEE